MLKLFISSFLAFHLGACFAITAGGSPTSRSSFMMGPETEEQMLGRHRREAKELQGRVTNKKKNATKKTRKGVNEECANLERQLQEKHEVELAKFRNGGEPLDILADDTEVTDHRPSRDDTERPPEGEAVGVAGEKAGTSLHKVAEKLHISEPITAGDDGKVNGDSEGGKKRNRQKERLARRAAEQEAAAERAEEEASTMTDHRARESEYMKKMFQTHSLTEKDIEPDGHCLFSAVADQLQQNAIPLSPETGGGQQRQPYKIIRDAAATYMESNRDDFAPFMEDDFTEYTHKMRDTAEWGGQLELMALARHYDAEIRVIQDGRTEKVGEVESRRHGKVLWLAYYRHGYGLGEHYNSLRRAAKG